jgi:hypothetical protein
LIPKRDGSMLGKSSARESFANKRAEEHLHMPHLACPHTARESAVQVGGRSARLLASGEWALKRRAALSDKLFAFTKNDLSFPPCSSRSLTRRAFSNPVAGSSLPTCAAHDPPGHACTSWTCAISLRLLSWRFWPDATDGDYLAGELPLDAAHSSLWEPAECMVSSRLSARRRGKIGVTTWRVRSGYHCFS